MEKSFNKIAGVFLAKVALMKVNPYLLLTIALVATFLTAGIAGAETLVESPHPYANNYEKTWIVTQPGADQVRLHFTKLEIGYEDTLQLLDQDNKVLITYTGSWDSWGQKEKPILLENYWCEWYALDTIKLKLTTNNEVNNYGFRIDEVGIRTTEQPVEQNLYESWDDYANNYESSWVISQPGADQMRLHFTKMEIGYEDTLQLLDQDNKVLTTYTGSWDSWGQKEKPILLENYWCEWYALDTIKLKLTTNNEVNNYGFRIDEIGIRTTEQPVEQNLYESWDDYANNYESSWVISQPGADQMRLHFTKMEIGYEDTLQLLDQDNKVLTTYTGSWDSWGQKEKPILLENYWCEWYALDTIKLKLTTNNEVNNYGFRIDEIGIRTTEQPVEQNLYESWHDYANNYESSWVISQPGTDQMRLHFTKMEIGYRDTLQLLDQDNKVLTTYTGSWDSWGQKEKPILLENYWCEWYALDTIKLKLTTNNEVNNYGFRIDQVDPPLILPLGIVTNLHNTTYNQNSITWTWTDPSSSDFDHVMVYLNDAFQSNVTKGIQVYSATGLSPSTAYTIGTRTVGITGLVNTTWVNQTATTAPETPTPVPPASISNLHNITYNQNNITWTWTDPSSSDFDHVMVYLNDAFQSNVTKGIQVYSAAGLSPSTAYIIGTRTVGTTGLVNSTWVNQTASTAPEPPTPVPPESISNLHNTTYNQNSITWAWTDPLSSDFDHVMVYLNNAFQGNVTKGIQVYSATGLSPSTAYTIGTRTVGTTGLVNSTWVNQTASTAQEPPTPVPPESISNLKNTTYNQNSITWTWTDPSSSDFDHVMVYLNDAFQGNVTKGTQVYPTAGLSPSTAYTIGTRTVGNTGLINSTWVNQTATTAPYTDPGITPPEAQFISNTTSGTAPLTVQFNDSSNGTVTSYAWDFGDGANSTEKNPVHTYTSYGTYNVSLTVTNTAGEDTIIKNNFIQVNPMVGGDTGYYLIHCNVNGAGVYFDEDYKGVITDGTLLVKIYLTATPYHRYSVSKAGYITVNEPLPAYPAKDQTKDIFVTLVDVTDNSWTRPPYPEVTRMQPGYPDVNWTHPPYPEVTRIQPGYPDVNWTRPPYPEVTRIQPGYPDVNWTRPPYPEVTRIQPGYPDVNWTRMPYPEVTRMPYPDWLWSHLSIKNFLKNIF